VEKEGLEVQENNLTKIGVHFSERQFLLDYFRVKSSPEKILSDVKLIFYLYPLKVDTLVKTLTGKSS
jgi:hypothetical protein